MSILAESRQYHVLQNWKKKHAWDESGSAKAVFSRTSTAVGKRIGILGYGGVGRQVANVARALGMQVFACTASPRESEASRRYRGYTVANTGDCEGMIPIQWHSGRDKKELLAFLDQELDYLLVSVPLTEHTINLLAEKEFEILARRNAFVINVSRGEIIDQDALIHALRDYDEDSTSTAGQGRRGLRGAVLDVAVPEPLPKDHPLWETPNCFISPHISGVSSEWGGHAFQILEENLKRMSEGKELLNQIDRETGYASGNLGH
jgi:phosphoglycerate dehydrogenase-like enzyme